MANVILIATGTLRTYRQIELAEELIRQNHSVRCINTGRSLWFMFVYILRHPGKIPIFWRTTHTPISEILNFVFSLYSTRPNHVAMARWADIIVVAPATCNTIGKVTSGITDNFPLLVIRVFERFKKVLVAPSMNPEMWADPFTQRNVEWLKNSNKYEVVGQIVAESLGSGERGMGIIADNEQIIARIKQLLAL
jgi:phosphopantothenoylcysteine synthetase/decarboxylase